MIAGRSSRSIPVTAPNPCGAGSSSRWRCDGQPCPLRPQSGSWFSMSSGSGQKTPASALLSRRPPRNRGSFAARPVASYSPRVVAEVKALACELPAKLGLPLSRFSRPELRRHVLEAGIVADISGVTIWRWLHEDRTASLETAELDLRGSHPPRAHSLCRCLRCGTGGVTRTRPAVRRRPVTVAGPRACRRDSLGARVADLERSRYGTILSRLAAPALRPFSCRIPAFSVRWMLTACKGKKEGSCGPGWTYVTSCPDCELLRGRLISVRSVVQVYPGPLDLRDSGVGFPIETDPSAVPATIASASRT